MSVARHSFDWYPTPAPFTRFLQRSMREVGYPIEGHLFAPCVGDGAILRAWDMGPRDLWTTNDLDPRWAAGSHGDATDPGIWPYVDWTVDNPPFGCFLPIVFNALRFSRVGVAMHLRISVNERLKDDDERIRLLKQFPPNGQLFLPRWAYQRSKKSGDWSTDSVISAWFIWLQGEPQFQFMRWPDDQLMAEIDKAYVTKYRDLVDRLSGFRLG